MENRGRGRGFGSGCERLHGELDDGDGRDIEELKYVNVLQPLYEFVGFEGVFAMPVMDTWSNVISNHCPPNSGVLQNLRATFPTGRP